MIAVALAALLSGQAPGEPVSRWSRDDVEARWGPASFSGPLEPPWVPGSTVDSYVQRPDDMDGLCRLHIAKARGLRWVALVYYTAAGKLVAVHCLQLGDLDTGYDVLPDVERRLRGAGT